ncbi:hypothetical protein [Streptomyces cyaneofuscatus]|uniref:Protein kinase domain-containing protein n=1 Tax=Streptomyces cyaneofuscatus TaxID=66883 RepID=A0ABZ1EY90_9ACTN|nr:hypothetical protein [Streptomyces cyaneofuscatus]WSB09082.1 hypothetical protein OG849_18435 [Streptomyces cyaneofuscatus]WSD47384.1 hypothetical protein OG857_16970 [Streptomyces cyaneofuscatus]
MTTSHTGRAEPAGARSPYLAFTEPTGRRRTAPARLGKASRRDPALPQGIRNGLLDDQGQQCVQVFLPAAAAADPAARALLDTEAGTALQLARTLENTAYAHLFPTLIGYELDTPEPFLLYAAPRGIPAGRTHVMSATDQRVFARDLTLALCLLDGQGLVPRGVSPGTVLWDGASVQLWGLEGVARAGRPRTPWGRAPYCSPEQQRGEGLVDARDAVWSAAQVLYQLVTGHPGPADRAPADLAQHRVLAGTLPGAFAPTAGARPSPATLLELLAPGEAGRAALTTAADGARPHQEAYAQALRAKRRAAPTPAEGAEEATAHGQVLCPYCLEGIQLDLGKLFVPDERMQYQSLDLSRIANPVRREDVMRGAVQQCTADPDFPEHHIPVPYLTHGRPLTVAMIGQSNTGKSHLLTQMIAEITDGGLAPHGVGWQSVSPEQHARFVRERVQPLRSGKVLDHTGALGLEGYAHFVESLLLTDARGRVRPVAFFDLAGEDLGRTDGVLRFLLGIDAFVFVVDPAVALPLPQLDEVRERLGSQVDRDGDVAFGTVLDRLPRTGPYLETPAAMVLGKSDLLRFQPPVDRWLGENPPAALGPDHFLEESGDVHALLRQYAGPAWLRPFDAFRRCTLHIASATGGQEKQGRFPAGTGPRRVLEPLLSLLAMHGIIEAPGGAASFGVGREAQ